MTNLARVAAFALAFAGSASIAQASDVAGRALMPAFEVNTIIRSMGFVPTGAPVLRGPVYVVRAVDDDDIAVRVTVDARSGRVLTVTELTVDDPYNSPARIGSYPAPPGSVPSVTYRAPPPAGAPPAPGVAAAPAVRQSAVTPRTPTPRPRPAKAPAEATASVPDAGATPGKSIPAPVAPSAARSSGSGDSGESAPKTDTPTETPLVPVAPLE